MPQRNLIAIIVVVLISFACYQTSEHNPFVRMFHRTLHEIEANYVDTVDPDELIEAGIRGMVKKLDENSGFNSPEKSQELQFDLRQQFVGIGVEVNLAPETQQLTVMGTLPGSPAFETGLLPGDRIMEIDGKSTTGFKIEDAVKLIRGRKGEPVRLSIARTGETENLPFTIRRAEIRTHAVLGDLRSARGEWTFTPAGHDSLGYLRVVNFGEHTYEELTAALKQLKERHVTGVILDLRGNPGGLLDAAVDICQLFVKQGTIVSLRGRDGRPQKTYKADGSAPYADLPLVVLVDRHSASASEIMAACLQDNGRAIVIGERSFGKGTVQNVIPLEQDRSLRLTTAHFYRPSGKNIHKKDAKDDGDWGVSPNPGFEIKMSEEELLDFYKQRRLRDLRRPGQPAPNDPAEAKPFEDEGLKKAIEYLNGIEPATGGVGVFSIFDSRYSIVGNGGMVPPRCTRSTPLSQI